MQRSTGGRLGRLDGLGLSRGRKGGGGGGWGPPCSGKGKFALAGQVGGGGGGSGVGTGPSVGWKGMESWGGSPSRSVWVQGWSLQGCVCSKCRYSCCSVPQAGMSRYQLRCSTAPLAASNSAGRGRKEQCRLGQGSRS